MLVYYHLRTPSQAAVEDQRVNELLYQHAAQASPHPGSVQRFVSEGADVCYIAPPVPPEATAAAQRSTEHDDGKRNPHDASSSAAPLKRLRNPLRESVLHLLISQGCIACVREAMQTPLGINFMLGDRDGKTPLHRLCERDDDPHESDVAVSMLRYMTARLTAPSPPLCPPPGATNTTDVMDWWSRKPYGCDLLSYAAALGVLGRLWGVLRQVPAYASCPTPLHLTEMVWEYDWEEVMKMEREERNNNNDAETTKKERFVRKQRALCHESRSTAELVRCALGSTPLEASRLRSLVEAGGNINVFTPFREETVLQRVIERGGVAEVAAVLSTPLGVDFTRRDDYGRTALHCSCHVEDRDQAREVLRLLVQRATRRQNGDLVREDMLFCCNCAEEGREVEVKAEGEVDYPCLSRPPPPLLPKGGDTVDFLSYTAAHQRLSLFWPVLKPLVMASPRGMESMAGGRLHLVGRVLRWDYDALPAEDKKYFQVSSFD